MPDREQGLTPKIEQQPTAEKLMPQLRIFNYAHNEVRLYTETDRVFADQNALDTFMKMAAKKIGTSINDWSLQQYGEMRFRYCDDSIGIRIQTGGYELNDIDREKLHEIVSLFNENCK